MGKSKQAKEKKFDRNVEISAPILDPEVIKAIHSPPRGHRLDLKHGGFKALLSDLNSQDSTDEMSPLNENHVPSYIGISCAVSGYSNYSSYTKRPSASPIPRSENENSNSSSANRQQRSRTTSPTALRRDQQSEHQQHHVHHITIDKNNIQSADEERKELTEKLVASAAEHRRSPSPITPTEDDRHHGTYVGARYCPLPPPSRLVNKHIPLLGIDDDQNPDDHEDESQVNKVEQKIANLYGDEFVEDWRESMTHKAKKELPENQKSGTEQQAANKNPKALVTLKPTPPPAKKTEEDNSHQVDVPTPSAKVLAGVEKQFLNRLLTDHNPPTPSPPPYLQSPVKETKPAATTRQDTPTPSPTTSPVHDEPGAQKQPVSPHPLHLEPTIQVSDGPGVATDPIPATSLEEHIEYEIRAQSPVDNEASPVRIRSQPEPKVVGREHPQAAIVEENLVSVATGPLATSISGELTKVVEEEEEEVEPTRDQEQPPPAQQLSTESENDGRYYLTLLDQEKSFILSQIAEAEAILSAQESKLDEDTTGRIRSAIGKANLLVNKKCNQFRELCESNLNANANEQYATLNDDLAGFWDMIRIQIEDVKRSFENVWTAKASEWNTGAVVLTTVVDSGDDESRESSLKDRGGVGGCKPKLSAQKDQERRERLKEHINQMKQGQAAKNSGTKLIGDAEGEKEVLVEADLEQVGCDAVEAIVDATTGGKIKSEQSNNSSDQPTEEAEEQLFSMLGSTSPPPPPMRDQNEEQTAKKPSEDLMDLLG